MTSTVDIRSQIKNANDINSKLVDIPEWDLKLKVIGLSAGARSRMASRFTTGDGTIDMEKLYPELVIATTVNPDNDEPVFTKNDVDLINQKSAKAIERLAEAARVLSGFGDEENNIEKEAGKD